MLDDFYGLATRAIENKFLRLEFLVDAGPRIVRVVLANSNENQFAELPDATLPSPLGDYRLRGGHRLWCAPEMVERTYALDDQPVQIEMIEKGARLVGAVDAAGIRKSIEIKLHDDAPRVTVTHRLQNASDHAIECAPWAITMLPLGGTAVLPLRLQSAATALLPDRSIVLWQYTRVNDPRLYIGDENILLAARAQLPPCKIGTLNQAGWLAYLRGDIFFVKRFQPQPLHPHVDRGCNAEIYCNDRFIELETLAPLQTLASNESADHSETWEWRIGVTRIEQIQELMK